MADMAFTDEQLEVALNDALATFTCLQNFELKKEQRDGIKQLASNKDLLAVLPTGFGKSMIFRFLVRVKAALLKKHCCVIVVCPLKSIIEDQVVEAQELGLKAASMSDVSLEELSDYELILGSAEEVLASDFLSLLRDPKSVLVNTIEAVVVDESHTVETWTGERATTKKGKEASAFRDAFAKLSKLRSFCKPGTPFGAITGTADQCTQKTIEKVLCLKSPLVIYVSPNRKNLRFHVEKVKKAHHLKRLNWLVELAIEKRTDTPKTIIFCNTINDVTAVVNYLICKLGSALFSPPESKSPEDSILGIYHSNSWQSSKNLVTSSLKGDGKKRIVVATTALCMGVNFPDIRYIINWGPARTILDQHQQAGRAGRDGNISHVLVIYHGNQVSSCEKEVKDFVRTTGCIRVAAYKSLDSNIKPGNIPHDCCTFCAASCNCNGDSCSGETLLFQKKSEEERSEQRKFRNIKPEDREDLKSALIEVFQDLRGCRVLGESSMEWFSLKLVDDVVEHCAEIFSIDDLTSRFPVFSIANALRVLELIQEVFLDIPHFEETMLHFTSQGIRLDAPPSTWIDVNDSTLYSDSFDSDDEELLQNLEL